MHRDPRSLLTAPICACLTVALAVPAHGGQDPPIQFESAIDVMRIHVGVGDARGGFVSGLGIDDFELFIDGAPRPLVDALEVSDATRTDERLLPDNPITRPALELAAATLPPPQLPAAARRHFLIFFDMTLSNLRSLRYARETTLEFVRNVAHPSDVLGLATYSPRRGLEVPVAFTTNHRRVQEVLEAMSPGAALDGVDPGGAGLDSSARAAVASDSVRERFEPMGGVFNLAAMRAFEAASGATRITRSAEDMLRGLRLLFDAMAPEQGRKHVLFFSNGLPNEVFTQGRFRDEASVTVAGAQLTDTVIHTFAPDSVTVANYDDVSQRVLGEGVRGSGPAGTDNSALAIMPDPAREFDPAANRASTFDERDVLHFLPDETGGTATFFQRDLDAGLAQIEAATRSFYVLAFRIASDDAEKVAIRVRTRRPGVEVAWAPSHLQLMRSNDRRSPLQSRLELASALESAADRADLQMDLRALPISIRSGFGRTAIVVQVEARELARLRARRGDDRLEFEILGQVVDSRGEVRDFFRTQAGSDGTTDRQASFRYYNAVAVPPGRYHIRVVVQELGSGRIASRRLAFDVPESPPVALRISGPVVIAGDAAILNGLLVGEQPAHRADRPVSYPFRIMGRDLTPDLGSVLAPGQRVELFALVYDLRPPGEGDDPQAGIDVALRNTAGDFVFVERFGGVIWERSPEDGAMRLGIQLWLPDDLPSGAWELVVQATDLTTGQSTDAGVDITVLSRRP